MTGWTCMGNVMVLAAFAENWSGRAARGPDISKPAGDLSLTRMLGQRQRGLRTEALADSNTTEHSSSSRFLAR